MKICHTVCSIMPHCKGWDAFSRRFPPIGDLLAAQARAGERPFWLALAERPLAFTHASVSVRFLRGSPLLSGLAPQGGWDEIPVGGPIRASRRVVRRAVHAGRRLMHSQRLLRALRGLQPDVVHHHGLDSSLAIARLGLWRRRTGTRLIVQDHSGGFPQSRIRRWLFKRGLQQTDRVIFADTIVQARWIDAGLLPAEKAVTLFAASSAFQPASDSERRTARTALGITGTPVFGWVAHLNPNKDPLTILRAFAVYCRQNPAAALHMHYRESELLGACEQFVAATPALQGRVFFRGSCAHAALESFYQAIDYFLLGSHHEAYGYALAEAVATGAVPVVSDLPGFRLLCAAGDFAHFFPPGNAAALAEILCALPKIVDDRVRQRIAAFFRRERSYGVLAQRLRAIYGLNGRR